MLSLGEPLQQYFPPVLEAERIAVTVWCRAQLRKGHVFYRGYTKLPLQRDRDAVQFQPRPGGGNADGWR